MAIEEPPVSPDRKSRKSVVFDTEAVVVEGDGTVTKMASAEAAQDSAQSHAPSTPPLSDALGAFTNPSEAPVEEQTPAEDGLDLSMMKKKRRSPRRLRRPTAKLPWMERLTRMKKKKKKSKKTEEDELAAKIAALEMGEEGAEDQAEAPKEEQTGDMDKGTGIWTHDETKPISYELLLSRFFNLLAQKNPDHASSGSKNYKIPPPQCMREGNKKTIFGNLPDICKRMKRSEEHVTSYLFAELGTSGSTAGAGQLVIKGRFQQKQIENVLRKYIIEYVTCKTCRSADTELNKGENRLYFINCHHCGSRRSVTAIKTGFSAQVGKRRKMRTG
ncbi:domain found in IF2B/IF5-domain-containing protein [Apiospora phragmitis]|uniref:Domain found in IF2B/IF5-domain-containing protein n=1 Tax=Apiospora phragmitis TaxID=2905665 RepID=A0ABR1VEC1_9PEZI